MAQTTPGARPPLRVRCFSIQNFRTFLERTPITFEDDVTVFHGETGSGKSTALTALDIYFRALFVFLSNNQPIVHGVGWNTGFQAFGRHEVFVTERDRPDPTAPTILAAAFSHQPEVWVEVRFEPAGQAYSLRLIWSAATPGSPPWVALLNMLFAYGSSSRPLAILDARRRARWLPALEHPSLFPPQLATELYALQNSRVAADRVRWRSFVGVLTSFPTLRGAVAAMEAGSGGNPPQLVIEYPGRSVLGLEELSSGEQELAVLVASLLQSKASIVAIQEPEMGLDTATQSLLRALFNRQREEGFVNQLIFESHAETFDGARVVSFRRDDQGWTRVSQALAAPDETLTREARERGAQEVFVSREGYTRLPEQMLKEIGARDGHGRVFFLRGRESWQAWPEANLEALLAETKDGPTEPK